MTPTPEQALESTQAPAAVRAVLSKLSERHRTILEVRFGTGRPAMTVEQVAGELGLTHRRIEQLATEALTAGRRMLSHRRASIVPTSSL